MEDLKKVKWKVLIIIIAVFWCVVYSITNAVINVSIMISDKLSIHQVEETKLDEKDLIISAIIIQESDGNDQAYNKSEQAAGAFQIRPIMVKEINRLMRENRYTLLDRYNREKATCMFIDYNNIVNPNWDFEQAARKWNGGPNGMRKTATKKYWSSVKFILKSQINSKKFFLTKKELYIC